MFLLKLILSSLDVAHIDRGRLRAVLLDLVDILTGETIDAERLRATFLDFLGLLAEATDTPLDDLLIERLREAGADDDVIGQFMKPDRIQ